MARGTRARWCATCSATPRSTAATLAATPQARLRCHSGPSGPVLEAQGKGPGLRAPPQGKLFGLFRRSHAHVKAWGVGLHMVKRLAENAGGTAAVPSQLGMGFMVQVFFP